MQRLRPRGDDTPAFCMYSRERNLDFDCGLSARSHRKLVKRIYARYLVLYARRNFSARDARTNRQRSRVTRYPFHYCHFRAERHARAHAFFEWNVIPARGTVKMNCRSCVSRRRLGSRDDIPIVGRGRAYPGVLCRRKGPTNESFGRACTYVRTYVRPAVWLRARHDVGGLKTSVVEGRKTRSVLRC